MDLKKLEMIIVAKSCPKCELGMVRETAARIYQCDHSQCGAVYDFSLLSDTMIKMLLGKKRPEAPKEPKADR